jgi:integrase
MLLDLSRPLDLELTSFLLTSIPGDQRMKGVIRPISRQSKCPACGKRFQYLPKLGYACPSCKTVPNRFRIDLHYSGERIFVCSDKQGQSLDSYQRASVLLSHIQHEIENHIFDPSRYVASDLRKYYFESLIDRWFEDKKRLAEKGQLSWSYLNPLKGHLENYIKPHFKGKDVRDLRAIDIKEFYRQLPGRLSPKSQKNITNALENFFNTLLQDEVIEKKPIFPKVSVPEPAIKWCTREVQDAILNAIPDKHRFIFFFLTRQGLRPAEAVAVKWGDIDLQKGIITVQRTMSNRKIVERTKTKTVRPRLIHPDVLDILKSIPRGLPNVYLFINPNSGKPYLTDTLQRLWKYACESVSVDIGLYQATRHSVASMAASSGVSIAIIKEVLGHTDIRTTQKYSHVDVLSQSQVFAAQRQEPRYVKARISSSND